MVFKRTDRKKLSKKVLYRKLGGGTFRTKTGKIVKPRENFRAYPEDIPAAFKDVIVPVEPEELQQALVKEEKEKTEMNATKYEVKERSPGWFDVVNSEGKAVNESALRKQEAEELAAVLSEK